MKNMLKFIIFPNCQSSRGETENTGKACTRHNPMHLVLMPTKDYEKNGTLNFASGLNLSLVLSVGGI